MCATLIRGLDVGTLFTATQQPQARRYDSRPHPGARLSYRQSVAAPRPPESRCMRSTLSMPDQAIQELHVNRAIELLAEAGATGALRGIPGAVPEGTVSADGDRTLRGVADAIAAALGRPRYLACLVSAPDNDPQPLDVPVRPDEEEPDVPGTPQTPDLGACKAA